VLAAAVVLALGLSISWGAARVTPGRHALIAVPTPLVPVPPWVLGHGPAPRVLRAPPALTVPGPGLRGYACPVISGAGTAGGSVCSKRPCSEFVAAASVATTMLMHVRGAFARPLVPLHRCAPPGPVVAVPVSAR
jgi:hypothetical protein